MAKDRFSNQKPIYWHSGFKQTGSFIKPEFVKIPKKKTRSIDDNDRLTTLFRCVEENLSEWEKEFMISILSHDNVLTDKQKAIIQKIKLKSLPFIFGDV